MKKLLLFFAVISTILAPTVLVGTAGAQNLSEPIKQACDEAKKSKPNEPQPAACANATAPAGGANPVSEAIVKASRVIATITAIAAVIVIMVAGFRYITSVGDPASINAAKNAILYALIGLVVAILAPFIIGFIVQKL